MFAISHGSVTIHSAPRALAAHITLSLESILEIPLSLSWLPQPLLAGTCKTEFIWRGNSASAGRITSALRGWHYLRFEVREESGRGSDGSFFRFTPDLGIHRADIGPHGDVMINENQLQSVITQYRESFELPEKIEELLGVAWDRELEPFRLAGVDGINTRYDKIPV